MLYAVQGETYSPGMTPMRKAFERNHFKCCSTQPTGCDGLLGSRKRIDKCLVCGGENKNCNTTVHSENRVQLPSGYVPILVIPKGATSIMVRESHVTRNYICKYSPLSVRVCFKESLGVRGGSCWRPRFNFYSLFLSLEGFEWNLVPEQSLRDRFQQSFRRRRRSIPLHQKSTIYERSRVLASRRTNE